MKVLTNFVRAGTTLESPLFLPDGEFLPEGTILTAAHLRAIRENGERVLNVSASASVREWEKVPELNAFMTDLTTRFRTTDEHHGMDMIRCAVEDVYSRFLFELDSEA